MQRSADLAGALAVVTQLLNLLDIRFGRFRPCLTVLLLCSIMTVLSPANARATTITNTYEISESAGDAWTSTPSSQENDYTAETLRIGAFPDGRTYSTGLRFSDIRIPPGSEVESARITMTLAADNTSGLQIAFRPGIQLDADSADFADEPSVVDRSPIQTAGIWIIDTDATAGSTQTSSELYSQVQALVDLDGWTQGGSMTFILAPVDSNLPVEFTAWDAMAVSARPQLTVVYGPPPPVVSAIDLLSENPVDSGSAEFEISFSMPVTGVDISDFTVTCLGGDSTGLAISQVTPGRTDTAQTFTITVTTGTGEKAFRIDLIDDDSITSEFGDTLMGATDDGQGGIAYIANGDFEGTGVAITTPAFESAPAVTDIPQAGLRLWLKADYGVHAMDDGHVYAWADASGQDNHALQYDAVRDPVFYKENNGAYTFTIDDAEGDGICCDYGEGSYEIAVNGEIVASGGQFYDSEIVRFNVPAAGDGCDPGMGQVRVTVLTDDYPDETTWTIVNTSTGAEVASGGPYNEAQASYETIVCLDVSEIHNRRSLTFEGAHDPDVYQGMYGSAEIALTDTTTVFVVAGDTGRDFRYDGIPAFQIPPALLVGADDGAFLSYFSGGVTSTNHGTDSILDPAYNILEAVKDGDADGAWLDTVAVDSRSYPSQAASGVYKLGIYEFTDEVGAQLNQWNGPISEVILYDRVLSAAERASVDQYLSGKYDIALGEAPTDITLSGNTVTEGAPNGTVIGTFAAVDATPDDTHVFTLLDDAQGRFSIDGNSLEVADEMQLDFETAESHDIHVQVRDMGGNGFSYDKWLTISVLDAANDRPEGISLSPAEISENAADGTTVGTLTTSDPNGDTAFTYTMIDDAGGRFAVSGDTVVVADGGLLDFEAAGQHTIIVQTEDAGGLDFRQNIDVAVTDVNEAPTQVTLSPGSPSIYENAANGTLVGTLAAVDPDAGQTLTFTLVTDSTGGAFDVSGNHLVLADHSFLDYETATEATVTVRATDDAASPLYLDRTFTIMIENGNDAPTDITAAWYKNPLPEDSAAGTIVGDLTPVDQDTGQTYTYTLLSSDPAGAFVVSTIDAVTGRIIVSNPALLDFETAPTCQLAVRCTDSAFTFGDTHKKSVDKTFTITLSDVNDEPPDDILLTPSIVAENNANGTVVGQLSATDPDAGDTHTFSMVPDSDTSNGGFLVRNNGQVEIWDTTKLDYESLSNVPRGYTIRVRAYDAMANTFEKDIFIEITDANDAPTGMAFDPAGAANERTGLGTGSGGIITWITVQDPDIGQSHTFSIVSDPTGGAFEMDGAALRTAEPDKLDYETSSSVTLRIRATDNGTPALSVEADFPVQIINANDPPTDIALSAASVVENALSGDAVGSLSTTDPDGPADPHQYVIVSDTSGGGFVLNDNILVIGNSALLTYNGSPTIHTVRIRSVDSGFHEDGWSADGDLGTPRYEVEKDFSIEVLPAPNDPPERIYVNGALTGGSIPENTVTNGYILGTLTADDPQTDQSHTFELKADDSNGGFAVDGDTLKVIDFQKFDFETATYHVVTIRATDNGSVPKYLDQDFTVFIEDTNDAPTGIDYTPVQDPVPENIPVDTIIGWFTATDPDVGQSHTLTITGGSDNLFRLAQNQDKWNLIVNGPLNYEAKAAYDLEIHCLDSGTPPMAIVRNFTIAVSDANDAPTGIILDNNRVFEQSATLTVVGNLTADDPDAGDGPYFFSLVSDSTDGGFMVLNSQLVVNDGTKLVYQSGQGEQVTLRVQDPGGLTFDKVFLIELSDVRFALEDFTLDGLQVPENSPVGTVIGNFSFQDPDHNATPKYTLVDNPMNAFRILDNQLQVNSTQALDFESESTIDIRLSAVDLADDGAFPAMEKTVTITITDVNDAPTDIRISADQAPERAAAGTLVGALSTTDPDGAGERHTYTLIDDPTGGGFAINGNRLEIADGTLLHYLQDPTPVTLQIQSTDSGYMSPGWTADGENGTPRLSVVKDLVINIVPEINIAPGHIDISADTAAENTPGLDIGTLTVSDDNTTQTHVFEIVNDPALELFAVDGDHLKVRNDRILDYETASSHTVRIRVTDNGIPPMSTEQDIVISVTDENDAATDILFDRQTAFPENLSTPYFLGFFMVPDPDAGQRHTITIAPPWDTYFHTEDEGRWQDDTALYDFYLDKPLYQREHPEVAMQVTATDNSDAPIPITRNFTFQVTLGDNWAPTAIRINGGVSATVAENAPTGTLVGTLTSVDNNPVQEHTYELVSDDSGDDSGGAFAINGDQLVVADGTLLDYESEAGHNLVVRSTDDGVPALSFEQPIVIHLADANDPPTGLVFNTILDPVPDSVETGSQVSRISVSDQDGSGAYQFFLAGAGAGDFAIQDIDGTPWVVTAARLNGVSMPEYHLTVSVTDEPFSFQQDLTIRVVVVPLPPTRIDLTPADPRQEPTVTENTAMDDVILGSFSATDANLTPLFEYTLTDDANGRFRVDGNTLKVAPGARFDFEAANFHIIRVSVRDLNDGPEGVSLEWEFSINVEDLKNETLALGNAVLVCNDIQHLDEDGNPLDDPVLSGDTVQLRSVSDPTNDFPFKTNNYGNRSVTINNGTVHFPNTVFYRDVKDAGLGDPIFVDGEWVNQPGPEDVRLFTGPCSLDTGLMRFTPDSPDDGPVLCVFSIQTDGINYETAYINGTQNPALMCLVLDGVLMANNGNTPLSFAGLAINRDYGIRFVDDEDAYLDFSGIRFPYTTTVQLTFDPVWRRLVFPDTLYLGDLSDYQGLQIKNLKIYANNTSENSGATFSSGMDTMHLDNLSFHDDGLHAQTATALDVTLNQVVLPPDTNGTGTFAGGYYDNGYWTALLPAGTLDASGLHFDTLILTLEHGTPIVLSNVDSYKPDTGYGRQLHFTGAASTFSTLDWTLGSGYLYRDHIFFDSGTDLNHGGQIYSDFILDNPNMLADGTFYSSGGELIPAGGGLHLHVNGGQAYCLPGMIRFPSAFVDWNLLGSKYNWTVENLEISKSYSGATGKEELNVELQDGTLELMNITYEHSGSRFTNQGLVIPSPIIDTATQWEINNASIVMDKVIMSPDGIEWVNPSVTISGFGLPVNYVAPLGSRAGMEINCDKSFDFLGETIDLFDMSLQFPKKEGESIIMGEGGGFALPKMKAKGIGVADIIVQLDFDPQVYFKFGGGVVLPLWSSSDSSTPGETGQGISGWVSFRDGKFDGVYVKVIGMNIPLGDSGVYMQDIGIGLEGTAGAYEPPDDMQCEEVTTYLVPEGEVCWPRSLVFMGDVRFTAGPQMKVGPASLTMLSGEVGLTTDIGGAVKFDGTVKLMGLFSIGGAKVLIVFTGPQAGVLFDAYMPLWQTVLVGEGGIFITFDGWVSGYMRAVLKVPDDIPVAGGFEFTSVGASFDNDGLTGEVKIIGIPLAFRVDGDGFHMPAGMLEAELAPMGEWEIPYNQPWYESASTGRTVQSSTDESTIGLQLCTNLDRTDRFDSRLTRTTMAATSAAPQATETVALDVPAGVPSFIRLNYEMADGDPHFTLTTPTGTVLTPEENPLDPDQQTDVAYRENPSAREAFYVLRAPEGGSYLLTLSHPETLGEYTAEVLAVNSAPSVEITDVTCDGKTLDVSWNQNDAEDGTVVSLFLATDRDGEKHMGTQFFQVTEDQTGTLDRQMSYDLVTHPVASRHYWIMARIDDGRNAPRYAFSDTPVYIPDVDAPPPVENIRVDVRNDTSALVTWDLLDNPDIIAYRVLWTDDLLNPDYPYDQTETLLHDAGTPVGVSLVTGLTPGKKYRFSVVAVKEVTTSETLRDAKISLVQNAARRIAADKTAENKLFDSTRSGAVKTVMAEANGLSLDTDESRALAHHALQMALSGSITDGKINRAVMAGPAADSTEEDAGDSQVRKTESPPTYSATALMMNSDGANNVPVITSRPGNCVIEAAQPLNYAVQAYDPDGDALTYAVADDGGAGNMEISQAGVYSWTPAVNQTGTWTVTLAVSDTLGAASTQTFCIYVSGMPPEPAISIASVPETAIPAGGLFTYDMTCAGNDTGAPPTFRLLQAPSGMSIDAVTGRVTWETQAPADVGSHEVTVAVTQDGMENSQTFMLEVQNLLPVPTAPAITTPHCLSGTSQVDAGDPNGGDTHTYQITSPPEHGAAIIDAGGLVTYTPTLGYIGADVLTVTVTDGSGAFATVEIGITVTPQKGDINGDCVIDLSDTIIMMGVIADIDPDGDIYTAAADVDENGKINLSDMIYTLRRCAGLSGQ